MTEEELYNLSDEELEAQFNAVRYSDEEEDIADEVDDNEEEIVEDTVEEEEEIEEDEVEDLEQPNDEDSDDDASTEDEAEDEEEDDSDTDDETADGETEDEEEQTDEAEGEAKEEVQPVQKHTFKANGREYEFTDEEVRAQFPKIFGQAMDYTKKMQAIKPWRKTIDALEAENVSQEDLNLMIDVLKGDKEAITEVVKRAGIDTLDLDTENSNYKPKDYGRDETELAIKDVIDDISKDKEYEVTQRIVGKEWDDASWKEMSGNPELIRALHIDVKTGMFDKVQAIADVVKMQDGGRKSDLDYYGDAARIYANRQAQEEARLAEAERAKAEQETKLAEKAKIAEVKAKQKKVKTVKQESVRRKAAAPTKRGAGTKKGTDYLDDSDEAFEEWYKNLQDKR